VSGSGLSAGVNEPHRAKPGAAAVGNTVSNGVPAPGAGNIETPATEDRYTFTVLAADAGKNVFFDALPPVGCTNAIRWQLLKPSSAQIFESGVCSDVGQVALTAGTYTLRVFTINPSDATGTYSFRILKVPPPQPFAYTVGNTVSNGVPGPGAGNLEVPGAEDRYTFTATAGQKITADFITASTCLVQWQLTNPSGGTVFNTGLCSDRGPFTLVAGAYTVRLFMPPTSDATGTYSFKIVNTP
jgi:hypothetical protein